MTWSSPVISVVIPTRDRCDVLALTLRALDLQKGLNGRFEVVVVDDGSSDGTLEMLRKTEYSGFEMKMISLRHGGPAGPEIGASRRSQPVACCFSAMTPFRSPGRSPVTSIPPAAGTSGSRE